MLGSGLGLAGTPGLAWSCLRAPECTARVWCIKCQIHICILSPALAVLCLPGTTGEYGFKQVVANNPSGIMIEVFDVLLLSVISCIDMDYF